MAIQNLFSFRFFLIFSPLFIMYVYEILDYRLFGVALLAIEVKASFIMENFGFLRTLLGRGLFNI